MKGSTNHMIIMENNLEILKEKRKKVESELSELEQQVLDKRKELDDLDDKIEKLEGIPQSEIEVLTENAQNFIKNTGKRPRPSYRENLNQEHEERTQKRQRRKVISPEIIQDEGNTDPELYENGNEIIISREEEFEITEEERQNYIMDERRRISKRNIEELLELIPEDELVNSEHEERAEKELTTEISKLYDRLCKQEGIFSKEKKNMMKAYFDFGKEFEREMNNLLDTKFKEEKSAVNELYNNIIKENGNQSRERMRKRVEKARKIFKIILAGGGRVIIDRLRRLNSENFVKISLKEIEEWVRTR